MNGARERYCRYIEDRAKGTRSSIITRREVNSPMFNQKASVCAQTQEKVGKCRALSAGVLKFSVVFGYD